MGVHVAEDEAVEVEAEQATDESAQIEDAVQDEATAVVDEGASDGEQEIDPEAVLDADVEAPELEPESLPRLSIDELREQYHEELEVERNTASQIALEQARRELGNEQATLQRLNALADEAGMSADDERVRGALKNNADFGANSVFALLGQSAVESMDVEGVERDTLLARINSTKPEENYLAAQQLMALSNERIGAPIGRQQILDMDIDEAVKLDSDSTLAKSLRARDARKVAADAKADELEGKPKRKRPPNTSAGEPVGTTEQHDLNSFIGIPRAVRAGQITQAEGTKRLAQLQRGVRV